MKNKDIYNLSKLKVVMYLDENRASNLEIYNKDGDKMTHTVSSKVSSFELYNLWLEGESSILTIKEQDYITNIIAPLLPQTKNIIIIKVSSVDKSYESLWIRYTDIEGQIFYLRFPKFIAGTRYKGMKVDYIYELEDLIEGYHK